MEAVIFDADGTLFDSRALILSLYAQVAAEHGLTPATNEEILGHMGKPLRDIFYGLWPAENPDVLVQTNNRLLLADKAGAVAFAGLPELLEGLAARGVRMGVVTGGSARVHDVLARHGIDQYFGSVVHSDRDVRQKPHPDGVLLALNELGVSPADAAMVGDMRYDILAGKNAGVGLTVGLTHGFGSRQELLEAGADHVVDSLAAAAELL